MCKKNCDIWRNPNAPQSGRIFSILLSSKFEVSYGGGEANVAVSLANYGMTQSLSAKYQSMKLVSAQLMSCGDMV